MVKTGPMVELEEMRSIVINALKYFNSLPDNTSNYPDLKKIPNLRQKTENMIYKKYEETYEIYRDGRSDTRLNQYNRFSFLEVIHGLLTEGVIMWGNATDEDLDNYPNFSITSYGKKVLEAEGIIPHDPDNYLENVRNSIPNIDNLVLMYLEESIQCYLRGNLLASSVMLGVASEAMLMILFNWMLKNVTNPQLKSKFEKIENKSDIKGKFEIIYNLLKLNQDLFEPRVKDTLQTNFEGIFHFIRLQRND